MQKRVLLAGLYHETNTFLPGTTPLDAFEVACGEEIRESEGDASPLSGILEVAREKDWELIPAADLRAVPGATVEDQVVEFFWSVFQESAKREIVHGIDGVYLVLHGAMVSQSLSDVEGELLRRVRTLEPTRNTPVCGVVDLHANFTAEMARNSNGLIAYRQNPHEDAKAAAIDAAQLLDRLMETGELPSTVCHRPPVMWPPTGTATAFEPMRTLEERARETELEEPGILAVNVFGGYSFADVPEAGVSFSALTLGDPERALYRIRELSALTVSMREVGCRIGLSLEEAMKRLTQHRKGPVLLVEPADNIGGGATGDNTRLLKAFLEYEVREAGVIINDPCSVERLQEVCPGGRLLLDVGGKSDVVGAEPLKLEVELLSRSNGRFVLEDRQSHMAAGSGMRVDMGPCAVVRHRDVRILLTSRRTPPFDLGQWRSQNINPEEFFAIGIKAAVAHRRAYDPISLASYTVDTQGPCTENLQWLPFRHLRRPVYPLDEV